jgi:hypothetical protein
MSNVIPSGQELTSLARQINEAHDLADASLRTGLENARRVGMLLQEARKKIKHGQWLPWLKANVKFSERAARNYLRIAEGWDELRFKSATVADLTQREALTVLAEVHEKEVCEKIGVPFRMPGKKKTILCGGPARSAADAQRILRKEEYDERREKFGLLPGAQTAAEEDTAFHEAGHAVISYLLGRTLVEVSLNPKEKIAGHVLTRQDPPEYRNTLDAENDILVSLAGEISAAKHSGQEWREGLQGDRRDIGEARDRLAYTGFLRERKDGRVGYLSFVWSQATKLRFVNWLRSFTEDLLENPAVWQAVDVVARELLQKRNLSGPQATDLIQPYIGVWKARVPPAAPGPEKPGKK